MIFVVGWEVDKLSSKKREQTETGRLVVRGIIEINVEVACNNT